jgi:hypothetical protein
MASWSSWAPVADGVAPVTAPVSAIANDLGVTDVFVTAEDGLIYTTAKADGGAYINWAPIPGGAVPPLTPISAVRSEPTQVSLFVVGTDHRIYTATRDDNQSWTNWIPVGTITAPPLTPVSAIRHTDGSIDLAVTAEDGRIYLNKKPVGEGWPNWSWKEGRTSPGTRVALVAREWPYAELFVTDGSGNVDYTLSKPPEIEIWKRLHDGTVDLRAPVTAISIAPLRVDVFVTDLAGNVAWMHYDDGPWSDGWQHVAYSHFLHGAPITAVSRTVNDMTLLAPGDGERVWTIDWTRQGGWAPEWEPVAGVGVGERDEIGAVARDEHTIEAFVVSDDGRVWSATATA